MHFQLTVSITTLYVFIIARNGDGATPLFSYSSATTLNLTDQDNSNLVTLQVPLILNGVKQSKIYVGENAMVTIDATFFGGPILPFNKQWISPFAADITTGWLMYQTFTQINSIEIQNANSMVAQVYSSDNFSASLMFVVTWYHVTKGSENSNRRESTFQLALATDGTNKSYAIFLYEAVAWNPTIIGISTGDMIHRLFLCDTGTLEATFLPYKSNRQCGTAGTLVFRIDETSSWNLNECTSVYTPVKCSGNTSVNRNKRCSA